MTPKSLVVLAVVTAIAIGTAVVVARNDQAGSVIADRGRILVPDLVAKANSVASITVVKGKTTMTMTRSGDGFVDATGYPVKTEAVGTLLTSLATLTVAEGKTDRPDRYADLDLADPSADKGGATEIELKATGGATIATVFAGTKDMSVGGSRGGQYVRVDGAPKSYLVRGHVEMPEERADWFDARLVDVKPKDLKSAELVNRAGATIDFVKAGDSLALATPPDGKTPDETKFTKLAYMFQGFDFVDVRKATATPGGNAASFKVETADGLSVTMTECPSTGDADKDWIRISAAAVDPKAEDAVKAIAAKTDGYEFKIRSTYLDIFGWSVDDLVKAAQG